MATDERIQKYENKMQKTLDGLAKEFSTIRAGRANPHILDKITVDYYGSPTPLQQVANIMVPEARMIQIQPWESSLIKDIQRAILASDLGLKSQQRRKGDPPGSAGTDRGAQKRAGEGREERKGRLLRWRSATCAETPTIPLKSWQSRTFPRMKSRSWKIKSRKQRINL